MQDDGRGHRLTFPALLSMVLLGQINIGVLLSVQKIIVAVTLDYWTICPL